MVFFKKSGALGTEAQPEVSFTRQRQPVRTVEISRNEDFTYIPTATEPSKPKTFRQMEMHSFLQTSPDSGQVSGFSRIQLGQHDSLNSL